MQASASRMQQLIYDLLDYSRLTSVAEPLGAVDLREAVQEAITNLELQIEQAEGTIVTCDLPTILAERSKIEQLFQNLIANALKYRREEKPLIKIYSFRNGNEWQIFVEDNGIGFDEKYLDRIFVPFQRLHLKNEYEGTGIGLSICRKIVERHEGTITAKSTPGVGSTFIITLPIKQPQSRVMLM
jgi:light-regulated signal transduction histidine kinase (bacteriophytochrome)